MMEPPANDLLNEHQRRALSTRLAMLDRFFYDVEQMLNGESFRREMFEVINDLSSEQREPLAALLNEGRREIRMMRDQLHLEAKHESVRRIIAGHLSILWTILEDSRAGKLAGFGDVSPALASELDPQIDRLIHLVNSLRSAIDTNSHVTEGRH